MSFKIIRKDFFGKINIVGGGYHQAGKLMPRARLSPCSFLFIYLLLFHSMHERVIILCKIAEEKVGGLRFVDPRSEKSGPGAPGSIGDQAKTAVE
jgi:hypothetical protein